MIDILKKRCKFVDRVVRQLESNVPRMDVPIQNGLALFSLKMAVQGWSSIFIKNTWNTEDSDLLLKDIQQFRSLMEECIDWDIRSLISTKKRVNTTTPLLAPGRFWIANTDMTSIQFPDPEKLSGQFIAVLRIGDTIDMHQLMDTLLQHHFIRVDNVQEEGQFSINGETLDIWSFSNTKKQRIFNPDRVIHSICTIHENPDGLRKENMEECYVSPQSVPESVFIHTWLKYIRQKTVIVNCESILDIEEKIAPFNLPVIRIKQDTKKSWIYNIQYPHKYGEALRKLLLNYHHQKSNILLFGTDLQYKEIKVKLETDSFMLEDISCFTNTNIHSSFYVPELKLFVGNLEDMVPSHKQRQSKAKKVPAVTSYLRFDLLHHDYVIHEEYGIGKYLYLEKMIHNYYEDKQGERIKKSKIAEFIVLEYAKKDKLYVPIEEFRKIGKYAVINDDQPVVLNSLDRVLWSKTKRKVKQDMILVANNLLETISKRKTYIRQMGGISHLDYDQFCTNFPYNLTDDQQIAIRDVISDLNAPYLMDRLICGDVGFGKTEIALRAAFMAVNRFQQVAVLVPTTILCEQHYETFSKRFVNFPVSIESLSRFGSVQAQKRIIQGLEKGTVDIVIGTHRLLNSELKIKKLGLLIIDEEHRFGVQQKESIKKSHVHTDILSLSATPIPRTLSMSLHGIRDISTLMMAPLERVPVETIVQPFDEDIIKEAITKELDRKGQIFYICNKVVFLNSRKAMLEKWFPGVGIGIISGQSSSEQLEQTMKDFLSQKWKILITTTIIETGMDIENANTLIVENAIYFGLSQLHQIRGRIGRRKTKGYFYCFFPDIELPDKAQKRLESIKAYSHLGSGMDLATKDMEIRGVGNLLGTEQHGPVHAIGVDLYYKRLEDVIHKVKSTANAMNKHKENMQEISHKITKEIQDYWDHSIKINVRFSAYIPTEYIENETNRIREYKKISSCRDLEDVERIKTDMELKYGKIVPEIKNLFWIVLLQYRAISCRLEAISQVPMGWHLSWLFDGDCPIDVGAFIATMPNRMELQTPEIKNGLNLLTILIKDSHDTGAFSRLYILLESIISCVI